MNSNTGISLLTGQEIIKEEFDKDELNRMEIAYDKIKIIIGEKEKFKN